MGDEESTNKVGESLIRLEAKIDVVLGRHEAKIDDLTRRQGETSSTLREYDSRITANALTVAETRALVTTTQADVQTLRNDVAKDVADIKQYVDASKPKNVATWAAVGVAVAAIVLTPILTALMSGH